MSAPASASASISAASRRRFLGMACAHCAALGGLWAVAGPGHAQAPTGTGWAMPERFARPDLATDEGGLWAIMDREEKRLRRSPFKIRDEALQRHVDDIVARLAGPHAPDVRVHLVRVPMFNASMAPNGMMQVWTGLLLRAENEAQLVAVLAHEMAHFLQRHSLHNLRNVKDTAAVGLVLSMFGLAGALTNIALVAGAMGFSRDQEREADRIGLEMMAQAGYDPREASRLWTNLVQEVRAGGGDTQPNAMFATHPGSEERADTLALLAADRSGTVGAEVWRARIAPWRYELLRDELRRDRPAETLVLIDRMRNLEPSSAELRYFRGAVLHQRDGEGDQPAALAEFEAAVSLGQEPPPTHRDMGYTLRKLGRTDAANAAFTRYLERAPDAPDAALIKALTEVTS